MRPAAGVLAIIGFAACGHQRDMAEHADMKDSMPVMRAMHDSTARDSMLDSMPGGKMVRGDSAATMKLLKKKM